MSKKPEAQRRAAAKEHRRDAAAWKGWSRQKEGQERSFMRQAAADHLKAARKIERGK